MERDQAESLLTSLKKLLDHLKERKVDLSHAPKQNDNESNCMFWTLTGAIRNIWQETEDIIGAELRGTKLLTSTWLHASDICEGKVDLLDYDNKEAFGTESGLSDEMKKCVEEARYAVTTFVRMKKELEQMKKEKASRLHDSASRCFDKLPESHSTLLKDTCSHGSDADQQTKAPNACTDMDIDNDDQMPLVSNDSEITENEYKQLRSDLEKGKIEKQDLLKETLDLLKRYEQKESDLKQLQNESEKVKKSEQDLFERYLAKTVLHALV